MCGISGIISERFGRAELEKKLEGMNTALIHRGPDGSGVYAEEGAGVAHRRLAIIDLTEEAAQPFVSADKRYVITYNGEIYNYKDLSAKLYERGHRLRTSSDTEVLLELYIHFGEDMLPWLNGMFAFAIWDKVTKTLFAARDRMGIKPFYYKDSSSAFYFASEPKAIFSVGVAKEFNTEARNELLLCRYVAGEATVYKDVKRLLPGHSLKYRKGSLEIKRWYSPSKNIVEDEGYTKSDFYDRFTSAVRYTTVSDVPLGVMLSGGLDSSAVTRTLHALGHSEIQTFTVGFEEGLYDESKLAAELSRQCNFTNHNSRVYAGEIGDLLHDACYYLDEPLVQQSDTHMLKLARSAKNHVKVLLSGEGADELLGGYERYKLLKYPGLLAAAGSLGGLFEAVAQKGIINRFDKLRRYSKNDRDDMILLNFSFLYPEDLKVYGVELSTQEFEYRRKVLEESRELYKNDIPRQAMYLDLYTHMQSVLDRNDRMTMGAGIECRVPFLDPHFVEQCLKFSSKLVLKGKKGKYPLFDIMRERLPAPILEFKKLGFSVPWEKYIGSNEVLKGELGQIKRGVLSELFPGFKFNVLFDRYERGDELAGYLMRHLLMVRMWQKGL